MQASSDFCGPFPTGEAVLVVIDAYSKYAGEEIIISTVAKEVLPEMERIFATHGIPEPLKSDNGHFKGKPFAHLQMKKGSNTRRLGHCGRTQMVTQKVCPF